MTNTGWLSHVRKTMYENAGYSFTLILKRANKTYKKKRREGKKHKKTLNKKNKKKQRKKK